MKAASPGHGTRGVSGQRAAAAARGHPRQPGERRKRTESLGSQRLEQGDGKERMAKGPSQGDGRGCLSPQRWLIAPAQSSCVRQAAQLARGETSQHPLHPFHRLADCSPRGWSLGLSTFSRLARGGLRALFGGEHPSPSPHALLPRVLPVLSLCQAVLAAAGPSACLHVCDVSDCVCLCLFTWQGSSRGRGKG